ncbi:MAG: rhodanese-like domain-containing protein [Desulfamplus sp.]|nr:rhodanese-like domain-containing protein [Desulfamplus sp.]
MKKISADTLRKYREKEHEKSYLLIDVRQPSEYEESHIPGSILLPLSEFEEKVEELPEKNIIFYCRSGARSRAAALTADFFNKAGKDIYDLEGGIMAWNGITIQGMHSLKIFDLKKELKDILLDAMNFEKGAFRFYDHMLRHYNSNDEFNQIMKQGRDDGLNEVTKQIKDDGLNEVLKQVRDGELGHAKLIYSHLKKINPDIPLFDEIYENLEGDILEGGASLDEMVQLIEKRSGHIEAQSRQIEKHSRHLEKQNQNQIIDILEIAISMEYRAFDLYRVISEHTLETSFYAQAAPTERLSDGSPLGGSLSDGNPLGGSSSEESLKDAFHSLAQAEKAHMNILVKALDEQLVLKPLNSFSVIASHQES